MILMTNITTNIADDIIIVDVSLNPLFVSLLTRKALQQSLLKTTNQLYIVGSV